LAISGNERMGHRLCKGRWDCWIPPMRLLPSSLVAAVVFVACPKPPPPIDVGDPAEGEGEAAEGEGEGEADEGEGEADEGEGEASEGEGEASEGEGEGEGGFDIPPIVLVTPEGSFCQGACALQVGHTLQLTAIAFANGGIVEGTPAWSVDDDSVATVDGNGLVTGVAIGSATVSAVVEGVTGTLDIDVGEGATADHLEVRPDHLDLQVGDTAPLEVTVFDDADNALDGVAVTFNAPDGSVVTVDAAGVVTAVGAGDSAVIVQAGAAFATVEVSVVAP
jgi:hypothetical protein